MLERRFHSIRARAPDEAKHISKPRSTTNNLFSRRSTSTREQDQRHEKVAESPKEQLCLKSSKSSNDSVVRYTTGAPKLRKAHVFAASRAGVVASSEKDFGSISPAVDIEASDATSLSSPSTFTLHQSSSNSSFPSKRFRYVVYQEARPEFPARYEAVPPLPSDTRQSKPSKEEPDQAELSHRRDTNPEVPLLEALFPEEAAKPNSLKDSSKTKRYIPRIPVDSTHFPAMEHTPSTSSTKPEPVRKKSSDYQLENREEVVLRFSGLSKYLAESDFRRLIPGGKHIEGWQQDLGDIERIIPGRNPSTLEREESYCLVFSSPASAKAYHAEATRLHHFSHKHTPTSLASMIPPPPGFKIDGEDAHAKLQSYALYPPSLPSLIRFEYQPFGQRTLQEVVLQEADQLMRRQVKHKHEVLLRIDGPQPTAFDVRNAISKDGVNRGLPWAVVPGPDNGVTQMKLAISLHGELHYRTLNAQGEDDEGEKKNDHCRTFHKWVIAFQTDAEARRFVRAWHKMPLPTWWHGTEYEEVPSIVHAEMLWEDI
ncbi:MAG: hypothetical protein M1822_009837 [Bathelium mastoideum]|nr:MAG: hypothetical protein M1822_009837 [Bathelium mastoideum]